MSQVQLITQRNIITADNSFDNFYYYTSNYKQYIFKMFWQFLMFDHAINKTQNIEHIRPNRCDNLY